MPTEVLKERKDENFKIIQHNNDIKKKINMHPKNYEPEDFSLTCEDRSKSDGEISQKLTYLNRNDSEVYEKVSLNSPSETKKKITKKSDESSLEEDWGLDKLRMTSSILTESHSPSFMLFNQKEKLMVKDKMSFCELLNIDVTTKIKVVSVVGNMGEGKSHLINETFFEGKNIFATSSQQKAATIGCWAAYDSLHQVLLLDTEGLLNNNKQSIRLLLKVMSISDVVIYKTRSERLHSSMFQFLGDACSLLHTHFSPINPLPSIIISHQTQYTELLAKGSKQHARELLERKFEQMGLTYKHFPSIHYVASKQHHKMHPDSNSHNKNTNKNDDNVSSDGEKVKEEGVKSNSYGELLLQVKQVLSTKSPKYPYDLYHQIKKLNDKFSGPLPASPTSLDQIFMCPASCLSCHSSCDRSMNHTDLPHHTSHSCTSNKLYNNSVYYCKKCLSKGRERLVQAPPMGMASYAWSGYSLECSDCGVIYRSRQLWWGNTSPEEDAVTIMNKHVWPGEDSKHQGSSIDVNMGQRVVDGVVGVSECLLAPSKYVKEWLSHQINPPYWEPNHLIKNCRSCKVTFSDVISIHHCRACGRGFCGACSSKSRPVQERGWGDVAVRVCDRCYQQPQYPFSPDEDDVRVRKVGEMLGSTVGAVTSFFNYPILALKEAARPDYWVPDDQVTHCAICRQAFKHRQDSMKEVPGNTQQHSNGLSPTTPPYNILKLHHCRACGQGVCDGCSSHQMEVPTRGWHHPVRVCDVCWNNQQEAL